MAEAALKLLPAAAWGEQHSDALAESFDGDRGQVEWLRDRVNLKNAILFDLVNLESGDVFGSLVMAMDGNEILILAIAGKLPDASLFEAFFAILASHFPHVTGIRVDTWRTGMIRRLMRIGFEPLHLTLWKPLHG